MEIDRLEIPVQNSFGGIYPKDWRKIYDAINSLIDAVNGEKDDYCLCINPKPFSDKDKGDPNYCYGCHLPRKPKDKPVSGE